MALPKGPIHPSIGGGGSWATPRPWDIEGGDLQNARKKVGYTLEAVARHLGSVHLMSRLHLIEYGMIRASETEHAELMRIYTTRQPLRQISLVSVS